MKKLIMILIMVISSMDMNGQNGNSCYIILGNYTGHENLHPSMLFDTVCSIVNRFDNFMENGSTTRWGNTFKIVTNLPYPTKAYKDDAGNYDAVYATAVEEIKGISPYYIGVIKEFHSSFIKYRVVMNLPNSGPLEGLDKDLLESLRYKIEATMNGFSVVLGMNYLAEIAGYSVLMDFLNDIENNTLDYFGMMGFVDIPYDGETVTKTSESFTTLTNGKNFGGIRLDGIDINNFLTFSDGEGTNFSYIISSKNDVSQINEIGNSFSNLSSKIKIWIHFDFIVAEDIESAKGAQSGSRSGSSGIMKVKFDNNFTEVEAESILQSNYNKKIKQSDCTFPNENFADNCIVPQGQDIFGSDPAGNFLTGLAAGFIGEIFNYIHFVYSSAQKIDSNLILKWGVTAFKFTAIYQSLYLSTSLAYAIRDSEAFRRKMNQTIEVFVREVDEIADIGVSIFNTINEININKLKDICVQSKEAFMFWLDGIISNATLASASLLVGKLVGQEGFEIALAALGGAALKAAKMSTEFLNFFKLLNKKDGVKNWLIEKLKTAPSAKRTKCGIIGGGCFMKDTPVLMASNNPFKAPVLAYSLAALPLIYPIQNVEPDDLVKAYHHEESYYATADNNDKVYVPGWESYDYLNITPETWQIGTFEIIEANGDKVEVEANRPKTWYAENKVNNINDRTWFYMPEIGINGEATLLSIRPTVINTTNFVLNESGVVDRPVITTFKRNAPVVYDYYFSDVYPDDTIGSTVIGATPEHPFFSVDRNNYIAVGELQLGEQVMTAGEKVVKFIAGKQRDKGEPVYNFEVWREHNYYVGSKESGEFLLVHNTYGIWDEIKSTYKNLANTVVFYTKQTKWTEVNITNAMNGVQDAAKKLEYEVALKLKQSGLDVKGIGLKAKKDKANGEILGDLDVLTDKGMVEVKTSVNEISIDQIKKYMDPTDPKFINPSKAIDPNAKKVLVYVKNGDAGSIAAKKTEILEALKEYKGIFDFDITDDLDDLANKMNN